MSYLYTYKNGSPTAFTSQSKNHIWQANQSGIKLNNEAYAQRLISMKILIAVEQPYIPIVESAGYQSSAEVVGVSLRDVPSETHYQDSYESSVSVQSIRLVAEPHASDGYQSSAEVVSVTLSD